MKGFSQYLVEADKGITFAWGRMNPPTVGHEKVMDATQRIAGKGGQYAIYITQTQDKKKNPLSYEQKVKYARKMFPRHARNILIDKKMKTVMDVLVKYYDEGYSKVTLVVGLPEVPMFTALVNKYNGVKAKHGLYNFQGGVRVVSAGKRDPDAEGVEGMSATKMRQAAIDGDIQTFMSGLPHGFREAHNMLNDVRRGLGLTPIKDFREHVELEVVSEAREAFVRGALFSEGDTVVIKESEEVATITMLGANYVVVETNEGKKLRKWIDDIELVEEMSAMELAKQKIEREKQRDARKHDRMRDNARTQDTKRANADTQPKYESFSSYFQDTK